MNIWRDLDSWRLFRQEPGAQKVGFVPTMGGLHAGHESLINRCQAENDTTVVSLFINPTQFDQKEDLSGYPARLERDLQRLRSLGVDHVLNPEYEGLYPDDFRFRVAEADFSRQLCGAYRKGHFEGVLTVVLKLLNLVRPRRAYFGEKDYQQLLLVQDMVKAFFLDTEIIPCTTIREPSGLALSTRNQRLNDHETQLARHLYPSLKASESADQATATLEAQGFEVEYVTDLHNRRLAAVWLGANRLIDNVSLESGNDC